MMTKELTDKQIQKYIERGGTKCPLCNSANIVHESVEEVKYVVQRKVRCQNKGCKRIFTESYGLDGIIDG